MATPFSRTLNSIIAERSDVFQQMLFFVCVVVILALFSYGLFFSSMLRSTENFTVSKDVTYQDPVSSGRPIAHNYVKAVFPKANISDFMEGGSAIFETEDSSNRNVQQQHGKIIKISTDDKSVTLLIDIPREDGLALELPPKSKVRIIIEGGGISPFYLLVDLLGLRNMMNAVSFYK